MTMFSNLIDFIKSSESFSAVPYYASEDEKVRGILTIGYGQTFPEDSCPQSWTEEQATTVLQEKLNELATSLSFKINNWIHLTQGQQDGLSSLAYNMGLNGFPALIKCLNLNDTTGAYEQFFNGIYQDKQPVKGLIYRRACEAQIFKFCVYERKDWLTKEEQQLFLKMCSGNSEAVVMIKSLTIKIGE